MSKRQAVIRPEPLSVCVTGPQITPSLYSTAQSPNEDQFLQAQIPVEISEPTPIYYDAEPTPSKPAEVQTNENMPPVTRPSQSEISDYGFPAVQYNVPLNLFTDNIFGEGTYSNMPQCCMPRVAETNYMFSPVHIDVGGSIYNTTLDTLVVFPTSRLGMMFSGSIPLVLDSLKQHYFIDRDGTMFRHILNYLRNRRLILPENFADYDLLVTEADYFGLHQMVEELVNWKLRRNMEWDINRSTVPTTTN